MWRGGYRCSPSLLSATGGNDDDGEGGRGGRVGPGGRSDRCGERLAALGPILTSSLLIAGTTVGGGFLALPSVVSPSGFVPSATALGGVWVYFLIQSMIVVECLTTARRWGLVGGTNTTTTTKGVARPLEGGGGCDEDDDYDRDEGPHPGIAAAARSAFGSWGSIATASLLTILTEATLVSQISRAGSLLDLVVGGGGGGGLYRAGCAAASLSVAAVAFGPRNGLEVASGINSALTVAFLISAAWLFGAGAPVADWSRLSSSSAAVVGGGGGVGWAGLPRAVPTLLQLLVYGEILPVVCRKLRYETGPIRSALVLGSAVPLIVEVGWAALGTALGGAAAGTGGDPVDILLAPGGPVRAPLLTLATAAILTTVIGSYLALQSIFDDVFPPGPGAERSTPGDRERGRDFPPPSGRARCLRRLTAATAIAAPALAIASVSPDLFLGAIDFAGSYPVLLLWGVAPPAVALRQRRIRRERRAERDGPAGGGLLLKVMMALSLGLLSMSALPDVTALVRSF